MTGFSPESNSPVKRLERESPGDIAMVGDEAGSREQLQQLKAIAVTDSNAFCFPVDDGVVERTMAFPASEKSALHAS
jgi:hypothetical protein